MSRLGYTLTILGVKKSFTSKRVLSANKVVRVTVFYSVTKQCFVVKSFSSCDDEEKQIFTRLF